MKSPWPITVEAETHNMRGRVVRMSRTVDGSDGPESAILASLRARRDNGRAFIGCEIIATTPLGQRTIRVLEEAWGELRLVRA